LLQEVLFPSIAYLILIDFYFSLFNFQANIVLLRFGKF